jgi:Leucine-rich repeat (LRR) protein
MPTRSESRETVSGKPSNAVELLRKRLRLGLGAMMFIVLGIGGVLGWVARRAHDQRDAVAAITTLRRNTRASVYYDWQYVAGQGNKAAKPQGPKWMRDALGKFDANAKPWGPKWLRDALGPDVFDTVVNVNIEGDNVDDELLENVGKLHGVEFLTIQGRAAPDLTPGGMAQLRTLSRLKGLSLRGFTDSHGFVAGLKGKTRLRRLWLPEVAVTDDEMAIIGGFADLELLKVDGRNITDRGFAHVANLKELSLLEMPGVRITDLAPVADLVQLDLLVLAPARATSERSVSRPAGPSSLAPLRRLTNVTQLILGDTQIEDRDLAVVAGLPKLNNLQMGARGITEAGLARLAESKSLACIGLADTSIADLRPLSPRLHAISTLWMENSHLTDAGIEPLSKEIQLTDLTISGSKMTDPGLDHLASLSSLWRLRLDRSAITDAGLARLKSLNSLESLSLTETKLTDSSVETLAGFQSLKSLNLDRSGISPAGIERLKQALPKARISSARMPE